MRKTIVAIGGGDLRTNTPIHREILRLSRKKHPKLLFVPTASSDSEVYWRRIRMHFGGFLKCQTDVLFLMREHPSLATIRKKISSADIIYVGGGNTLQMMRIWRRAGVDRLLKSAYRRGCVLCGASAGSICWFDSGHSDSLSYYNPKKWKYINVKGLGLLHGVHCPHYNGSTGRVPRRKDFQEMMGKIGGVGIAIENYCAIEFIDGRVYRVLRATQRARAFVVCKREGEVVSEPIPIAKQLAPVYWQSRLS